jgi:hypothetical protein
MSGGPPSFQSRMRLNPDFAVELDGERDAKPFRGAVDNNRLYADSDQRNPAQRRQSICEISLS